MDAGVSWIGHLSVHLSPNIFQSSAGSENGLAVYVEHSIAGDFVCLSCNTGEREHMKSKFHKAAIEQWRSFAGSLFVLAKALSGNAFGRRPYTLCWVSYCVAWRVMLSGASREVARLPFVSVRVQICTLSPACPGLRSGLLTRCFAGVCSTVFFLHALNSYGHRTLRC